MCLVNLNLGIIVRLREVTVTGGVTRIVFSRTGRDRHFNLHTNESKLEGVSLK